MDKLAIIKLGAQTIKLSLVDIAPNGYYKAQNIEFVVKNGKLYVNDAEVENKTITISEQASY